MIIFVAGIHAVGKTYLGGPVASTLGLRHVTASQLIREERGLQTWGLDKRVTGVDENQNALISAVRRLRNGGESLLLDGHFVLRDHDRRYVEISDLVFESLGIDGIALLEADASVVQARLYDRGDTSWSLENIAEFAEREAERAKAVSSQLTIPMKRLFSPTAEIFLKEIQSVLGTK